jgi:hypothetical protein
MLMMRVRGLCPWVAVAHWLMSNALGPRGAHAVSAHDTSLNGVAATQAAGPCSIIVWTHNMYGAQLALRPKHTVLSVMWQGAACPHLLNLVFGLLLPWVILRQLSSRVPPFRHTCRHTTIPLWTLTVGAHSPNISAHQQGQWECCVAAQ